MLVGLFVRGIKVYQNINFIPFLVLDDGHSIASHNFISYIGANGSGKSSILEALDSFFNRKDDIEKKDYKISKNITSSSLNSNDKNPFIVPIFLIKKSKMQNLNMPLLEELSGYLWNVESNVINDSNTAKKEYDKFFKIRDSLRKLNYHEDCHLIALGERPVAGGAKNLPLYSIGFVRNKFKDNTEQINDAEIEIEDDENKDTAFKFKSQDDFKSLLGKIKELHSYIYLPVEANVQDFTKLETSEMQKLIDKQLKDEIENILQNNEIVKKINNQLDPLLQKVESDLKDYTYKAQEKKQRVTNLDLIPKIIEAYFETKYLYLKGTGRQKARLISELSAGEKRKALIAVVSAFLENRNENELDKDVIIAVDEPENSLHISLCYEQFEKLHKISAKAQVLITTHWYGFLPIINYGYAHFLTKDSNDKVSFDSYSLYDYRSQLSNYVQDFRLKSNYDLVQSIYHSLIANKPYNWLLVEGITDKLYLEAFLDKSKIQELNLKILPLGGQVNVKLIFELLRLPLQELGKDEDAKGKVFCLVDTDKIELKLYMDQDKDLPKMVFRRLSHYNNNKKDKDDDGNKSVFLLNINCGYKVEADIEQCLNPEIFEETYKALGLQDHYGKIEIEFKKGNTNFVKNLKIIKLENFFKGNEGKNKVDFCKKYIEIFESKENKAEFVPKWINVIKKFFETDIT